MKTHLLCLLLAALALTCGCKSAQRSISNSGFHGESSTYSSDPAFAYRGELSEFDVLAVKRDARFSNAEIATALDGARRIELKPGSSMMVIQSGAAFPDGPMTAELSKHFRVTPFSGLPKDPRPRDDKARAELSPALSYSESLRMAAARGGCETILCYWGLLESTEGNAIGKPVSWVPVVHWLVPDKKQHMRIRLKLALVDVRTGGWSIFTTDPFEDQAWTTSLTRGSSDQRQVESLKKKAYEASVRDLMKTCVEESVSQVTSRP